MHSGRGTVRSAESSSLVPEPDDMEGLPAEGEAGRPAAPELEGLSSTPAEDRPWWSMRRGRVLLQLIPGVSFLLFWDLGSRAADSALIPAPIGTLSATLQNLLRPDVWEAFLISNRTLFLGFVAAICVGVPLGLLMGRLRAAERLADVWLDVLMVTPMAAIIPLIIMALGLDLTAQAVVVFTFALPMLTINVRAGVREVKADLLDMSRVFGATEMQIWRSVILPSASPHIYAGLRISLGRAFLGMVFVELLMSAVGVGRLLQVHRARFETEDLYSIVLLIVAESIALISAMRFLERRLTTWQR